MSSVTTVQGSIRKQIAERTPRAAQGFLTWVTAQPADVRAPRPKSPLWFLAEAIGMIAVGLGLGALGFVLGGWWLLPTLVLALILVTGGIGIFQVVVLHHASHGTFLKGRRHNRLLGRIICGLFLFKQFDQYQHEHMRHHSLKVLFTEEDEFTQFVIDVVGLKPGLAKQTLKRRLIGAMVSPVFHARFAWRRIQVGWLGESRMELAVGLASVAVMGTLAALGLWVEVLVLWLLPLLVLLQIATIVRIVVEHRMPNARDDGGHNTYGTFVGEAPPPKGLNPALRVVAWTGWWARMVFYHLPCRLVFMVGDAPAHDFHHLYPATKKWTDYISARQNVVIHGDKRGRELVEIWGVWTAIDECLEAISHSALQYGEENEAPHRLAVA